MFRFFLSASHATRPGGGSGGTMHVMWFPDAVRGATRARTEKSALHTHTRTRNKYFFIFFHFHFFVIIIFDSSPLDGDVRRHCKDVFGQLTCICVCVRLTLLLLLWWWNKAEGVKGGTRKKTVLYSLIPPPPLAPRRLFYLYTFIRCSTALLRKTHLDVHTILKKKKIYLKKLYTN